MRLRFDFDRWQTGFLTGDPAFAEILVGTWLCGLRGLVLLLGQVGAQTHAAFRAVPHELVGLWFILLGAAQVLAVGIAVNGGDVPFRLRALVAFVAAVSALGVTVLYFVGSASAESRWAWATVGILETGLTWRLLLWRVVAVGKI